MLQKFASPAEQTLAKGYVDALRQHHFEDLEKAMDPSIVGTMTRGTLAAMSSFIPMGEPQSITLVGAHRSILNDSTTVNTTYEYAFAGKLALVNLAIKTQADKSTIVGFSVVPQLKSLAEQNRFTLDGKTALHYVVLALTVLLPLLTLFVLVLCIRTPFEGRKWPWVVFVLVGFGKLSVNWVSGDWSFAPAVVQLFSASAFAPPYGPWTLSVSLPLGALVFLLMRSRLRASTAPVAAT